MESTRLKECLTKVERTLNPKPKPTPVDSTYSTHQICTQMQSSKDPYTYVTPFIKYFTESKNGELILYLLTKSQKHIVKDLHTEIVKVMVYYPTKNTLFDKFKGYLLVATKCQIKVFGMRIESIDVTLVNIGIEVGMMDEITNVAVNEDGNVVFSTKYNFYQLCYMHGLFASTFSHKLRSFKTFLKGLIWDETKEIRDICVGSKYAIALRNDFVEIYKVGSKMKFLRYMSVPDAHSLRFYDENIFYIINKEGRRLFYDINAEMTNVELPQEITYYDGDVIIQGNSDVFLYLKKRKDKRSCILMVITQNPYYKGGNVYRENYQTFTINDDINSVNICNRTIILTSKSNTYRSTIMKTYDYLVNCRQEEIKKLYGLFGGSEFLINYLFMIENRLDTSKIEFLFLKSDDYSFIYKYIYKKLAMFGFYGNKIDDEFHFKEDRVYSEEFLTNLQYKKLVELSTVYSALKDVYDKLWRYRKEGLKEAIDDLKIVMHTVLFVKIVTERELDVNLSFESLMFSSSHRERIFSELSGSISFERANEIFAKRLRDYFPIEQIHFQRGMENVKRKRKEALYESLMDFKECNEHDATLKVYNESKFFIGCITLIKDCIFDSTEQPNSKKRKFSNDIDLSDSGYAYYVGLLKKHMLCKGALLKALDDYREEFVYVVLESYMRNLISGVFLTNDCSCCDRNDDTHYYNTSVDLIFLDTPHLLPFLEEKAMLSYNEHEYILLWKYHLWKKNRTLAQKHLFEVIKTKPMSFNRRIELLRLCVNIDSTPYMKSIYEAALVQKELIQLEPENAHIRSSLLDPNELFNTYLYPDFEHLCLKIMMISNYDDINFKRSLFDKLLSNDYANNVEKLGFLKDLNKNDWVEIEIVGDILIRSLERENPIPMISVLLNYGYNESEVKGYLEGRIRGTVFMHPEIKRRILNEFIRHYGKEDHTSREVKKYCLDNFGIKV